MLGYWDEIEELERRLDDALRRFVGTRGRITSPVLPLFVRRPFLPATDVYAKDGDLIVRVELPGIDPREDVSVQVEGGELVVRGERKQKEEVKEEAYYRMEASFGSFERRIPMPEGIDVGAIEAAYTDGVLTVTVPKAAKEIEPPRATEIPVKTTEAVKAA
jgi:HSP20 family molecular chaperone IbpA